MYYQNLQHHIHVLPEPTTSHTCITRTYNITYMYYQNLQHHIHVLPGPTTSHTCITRTYNITYMYYQNLQHHIHVSPEPTTSHTCITRAYSNRDMFYYIIPTINICMYYQNIKVIGDGLLIQWDFKECERISITFLSFCH